MAWHKSSSVQGSCSVSPAVWLWVLDAISSPYQKALDQFHMRCLRQIAHIKWQGKILKTEVLAEMSNYWHRSVPANTTTLMDGTCCNNGQQPSNQDDLLRSVAARSAHTADSENGTRMRSRLILLCLTLTWLTLRVWQQTEVPSWHALCHQSIGSF